MVDSTKVSNSTVPIPDPTALTTEAVDRAKQIIQELFSVQLESIKKDLERIENQLESRPAAVIVEINHLRQLMDEKFKGVADQFAGRDTALAAALLAQKTSVDEQNKSNALSGAKAEAGFTKEIDAAKATITASAKTADDKIEDLRTRIGAVENQKIGARDNTGMIVGIVGVAIAVITMLGTIGFTAFNR